MRFQDAKKLHNGDEVIDKKTDESINVLEIEVHPNPKGWAYVEIRGVGSCQGYKTWYHDEVK